jgi:ATP-dependent exoDNAse (exonuclease V) alpha subunit
VVLAGDPATLPSPAPGLFFRDLLAIDEPEFGGQLPRVQLKTRPTGPLTALVDAVRHGGLPPRELLVGPDGAAKQVVIVPVKDAAEALHRAVQLAADSIPRTFEYSGSQIQVLAGSASGAAGVGRLNTVLKQRFNPGPGVCAGFDAGDRVVVRAPLPEFGLLRGETATVEQADAEGASLTLDPPHGVRSAQGAPVGPARLTLDECRALRHAWALTVQEAQGGRWPAVVAVFDAECAPTLSRALVLGAIVAATDHLSVVHGAGRALARAVDEVPDHPRRTRLRHALRD